MTTHLRKRMDEWCRRSIHNDSESNLCMGHTYLAGAIHVILCHLSEMKLIRGNPSVASARMTSESMRELIMTAEREHLPMNERPFQSRHVSAPQARRFLDCQRSQCGRASKLNGIK